MFNVHMQNVQGERIRRWIGSLEKLRNFLYARLSKEKQTFSEMLGLDPTTEEDL